MSNRASVHTGVAICLMLACLPPTASPQSGASKSAPIVKELVTVMAG